MILTARSMYDTYTTAIAVRVRVAPQSPFEKRGWMSTYPARKQQQHIQFSGEYNSIVLLWIAVGSEQTESQLITF